MNDLDLYLVYQGHVNHYITFDEKPLEIEAWFQRTTNRKWHMGYRMVKLPMTSRDLERSTRDANTLRAQCLENGRI